MTQFEIQNPAFEQEVRDSFAQQGFIGVNEGGEQKLCAIMTATMIRR